MADGMARVQGRKWQITINNPAEHGFEHEAIKAALGQAKGLLYYCLCDEEGDECETLHSEEGKQRTHAYYCHPYTSCERGSNENANRLIRRWLPKGKSLKAFTSEQALALTRWMNNYPREILGWKTPAQVFLEDCEKQGIEISPEFSQYLS